MPAVRAGAEWWPVVPVFVLPVPSDAECLFTSSPSAFLRWGGGVCSDRWPMSDWAVHFLAESREFSTSQRETLRRICGLRTFPPGPRLMLIFAQRPLMKK